MDFPLTDGSYKLSIILNSKDRWSATNVLLLPARLEVCPSWCMVPLCYARFIAFTSVILLPGTNWKEKKATCKFLWISSKPQTSSDPDPSRGRKRVWAHNKQRSLLCKQSFKQMDLNKQNFEGGRVKKEKKMILALENLCDLQNQSCCLPEHTSNQPWPPPSSRGHECPCCFPPALWAPEAPKSPAGIAQHVPLPFHTQGSSSWRRFAGGAVDYRPGCLQLPCAWLALATPASPIHHQLLPPATLPCSLSSQQTNVVSAGCCLLPGHISAAPKVLQLFREAGHSHKGSQPEKKLSSERMVFFCPPQYKPKNHPRNPREYPQTCPIFACLTFLHPKPALSFIGSFVCPVIGL